MAAQGPLSYEATMFRTCWALVVLLPALSLASPSARLLDDAPKVINAATPRLIDQSLAAADAQQTAPAKEAIGLGELFAKTYAVAVASSAAGIVLGAGLGVLSNNLIGAAIPGLLIANLILPPLLTVLAATLMGNWDQADRFGFWLPLGAAFLVNAAAIIVTGLFLPIAVGITNPLSLVVFSLIDGLLMSGASIGVMALTEKKKVSTVSSFVPGVTDTTFVTLSEVKF